MSKNAGGTNQYARRGQSGLGIAPQPASQDLLGQAVPSSPTAHSSIKGQAVLNHGDIGFIAGTLAATLGREPSLGWELMNRLDSAVGADGIAHPDGQGAPTDENGDSVIFFPMNDSDIDLLVRLMNRQSRDSFGTKESRAIARDIKAKLDAAK